MIKHATASVFVMHRDEVGWRTGLVLHPVFDLWIMPGGHIDPDEDPPQAALREVNETLERRVAERTADLSEALNRLQAEVGERLRAEEALRAQCTNPTGRANRRPAFAALPSGCRPAACIPTRRRGTSRGAFDLSRTGPSLRPFGS